MGLLATMSALVVGLLITTAKTAYDTQGSEFRRMSAEIVLVDRLLAHYGPETKAAREQLRQGAAEMLRRMEAGPGLQATPPESTARTRRAFYDEIQALSPQTDAQRSLRAEALRMALDIGLMRWLMFAQRGSSIPAALPGDPGVLVHDPVQRVWPLRALRRDRARDVAALRLLAGGGRSS